VLNRRNLLKTLGLGALAAPTAVSAQSKTDRPLDQMHPVAVARRIATMQLAFQQKTGTYDHIERVTREDSRRVPDDHPLKAAFLQGAGFDDFGLDVAFELRDDRSGYWMTIGGKDSTSRYYVNEKNVIYRSTDDADWSAASLRGVSPDHRLWTPIVRKEFNAKTASSGFFGALASVLNAVVPVVHAQGSHADCCGSPPWWWWDCWDTHGAGSCVDPSFCDCSQGYYFCVQGFQDCQGCCINCSGNCSCVWDLCTGS